MGPNCNHAFQKLQRPPNQRDRTRNRTWHYPVTASVRHWIIRKMGKTIRSLWITSIYFVWWENNHQSKNFVRHSIEQWYLILKKSRLTLCAWLLEDGKSASDIDPTGKGRKEYEGSVHSCLRTWYSVRFSVDLLIDHTSLRIEIVLGQFRLKHCPFSKGRTRTTVVGGILWTLKDERSDTDDYSFRWGSRNVSLLLK